MIGDMEIIVWQLGRIHDAALRFRAQEAPPVDAIAWWDPGSMWSVGNPANAMDFAAFQTGVTAREVGGLSVLTSLLAVFAEKSGRPAAQWLAAIWAELQPDWDARSQFLSSLGDDTK